ncbi:hypothetical protein CesoFtcFv8_014101 [Champsocephalus esox]|uniref:Uncharacterized protein n=1 Tax=Champsocephalus esox TaxID=159716 RepID=A0AAN8BSV7_9TELE|nr:hypothetical protein CesoFtcFv8_014101 [Champsocephalus esox]
MPPKAGRGRRKKPAIKYTQKRKPRSKNTTLSLQPKRESQGEEMQESRANKNSRAAPRGFQVSSAVRRVSAAFTFSSS